MEVPRLLRKTQKGQRGLVPGEIGRRRRPRRLASGTQRLHGYPYPGPTLGPEVYKIGSMGPIMGSLEHHAISCSISLLREFPKISPDIAHNIAPKRLPIHSYTARWNLEECCETLRSVSFCPAITPRVYYILHLVFLETVS